MVFPSKLKLFESGICKLGVVHFLWHYFSVKQVFIEKAVLISSSSLSDSCGDINISCSLQFKYDKKQYVGQL